MTANSSRVFDVFFENQNETRVFSRHSNGKSHCKLCNTAFDSWQQQRTHYEQHGDEKPFRCNHCDDRFNVEINLRLHYAYSHFECGRKPQCPECHKTFSRLASLRSHLIIHRIEENIVCPQCEEEFDAILTLKQHLNSKHPLETNQTQSENECISLLSCKQCQQTFRSSVQLREHTKLHSKLKSSLKHKAHRKQIDRSNFFHKCDTCEKTFKKNSQLIRHIRIHTGEKPFVCTTCGKGFNQKNSLQIHESKHTGEKKYKCKFCEATFSQQGNMRCHIDRVHVPEVSIPPDQLFKCSFCPCVFRKIGSLNCHVSRRHVSNMEVIDRNHGSLKKPDNKKMHTKAADNIKNNMSNDLLKEALKNSGLTQENESQDENGIKTIVPLTDSVTGSQQSHIVRRVGKVCYHQCVYCPKEFKKSSDLVRHIRIHNHERPFKCTQCFRSFTVKSTLKAHLKTHTGIKDFNCTLCEKKFSSHQSLKVHFRIHSGALPYSCNTCAKKFRTVGHLKSHLETHKKSTVRRQEKKNFILEKSALQKIQLEEPIILSTDVKSRKQISLLSKYGSKGSFQKESVNNSGFSSISDRRNYKCSYCDKAFKKSSHLQQHVRSHTGEKPFQCTLCSQSFISNGSLKAHLRTHSGEKPYKCNQCDCQFSTKGSLTRHAITHSSNRPFMCPYCQKTFKASLNCKKHMKIHRTEIALEILKQKSEENKQVDRNYPNPTDLGYIENVYDVDSDGNPTLQIANDSYFLTSLPEDINYITLVKTQLESSNVALDINTSLENPNLNFNAPCDTDDHVDSICNESQSQSELSNIPLEEESNYEKHLEDNHSKKCSICFKLMTAEDSTNNLNQCKSCDSHLSTCDTAKDVEMTKQTFNCQLCNNQFNSIELLNDHIDSKHQESLETSKFTDNQSGEATTNNNFVNLSISTNVSNEKSRDEQKNLRKCGFCSKLFKKPSDLVRHVRIHTGEKPYSCSLCNKQFTVKSTLDSHIQTHKNERNFKCSICNSLFSTKGSLNVHMRLHTGDRPFKCNVCSLQFRTSGHLKSHAQKHEKERTEKQTLDSKNEEEMQMVSEKRLNDDNLINDVNMNNPTDTPFILSTSSIDFNELIDNNADSEQTATFHIDTNLLAHLIQIDTNLIPQLQSGVIVTTASPNGKGASNCND
ncbi:zinc finger protein 236-like protein [Dinothrombium tinctorium]|uniref:Zinc finger protein 236-like protein n=1 Tax=Dinothrombium tinctorium TaxID=1965070 RepID=A0A3S3P4A9_9ACAR|nr:zinc finger protein 236-like protein [Dinothrombium tinctorium]RWS11808.1 zinc finger protein 236-like protein [Dinothrombium tinctorium]